VIDIWREAEPFDDAMDESWQRMDHGREEVKASG
jgi:hypothetical protein